MSREDIQKLLGGYATGTLTPEEQQALFSAALEDQELFDALAREQPLRELLDDPGARAHLLAALDETPEPWYARWWRPAALALATASVAVLAIVAIRQNARPVPQASVTTMAEVKPAAPAAASVPEASQTADQDQRAKVAAPSPSAVPAKRQSAPPEKVSEKPVPAAPELPSAVPARDPRPAGAAGGSPGGVVGGIPGGIPAPFAPAPPVLKTEPQAKDQVSVAELTAPSSSQRARMLFFGPQQVSGFLRSQDAPAANAQSEAAPAVSRLDKKKQPQNTAPQARTMMRSTTAFAGLPGTSPLGIRYTLLRRSADGAFLEAPPGGIQPGDTVQVRFEANQDGFLSVLAGGARPIAAIHVSQWIPYITVPIEPGTDQLTVRFSRVPLTGAAPDSSNLLETPGNARDRATYAALSDPAADPLTFTIALR